MCEYSNVVAAWLIRSLSLTALDPLYPQRQVVRRETCIKYAHFHQHLTFTFNHSPQLLNLTSHYSITSINMPAHTQLNSKAEFDKAIQEQDKYVFIYCYEGSPTQQAEEYVGFTCSAQDHHTNHTSGTPRSSPAPPLLTWSTSLSRPTQG